MKLALVFLSGLTALSLSVANARTQPFYAQEWCDNVQSELNVAVATADRVQSHDEEVAVLKTGIENALNIGSPDFQKFFQYTLKASLRDMHVYNDSAHQAFLLRNYIQFALDDLNYLDQTWRDQDDNGPYIKEMLERARDMGLQAPEDREEMLFLQRAAQRGIELIDASDYRRSQGYACTRIELSNALSEAADPSLGSRARIELLREAIDTAIEGMSECHWHRY